MIVFPQHPHRVSLALVRDESYACGAAALKLPAHMVAQIIFAYVSRCVRERVEAAPPRQLHPA